MSYPNLLLIMSRLRLSLQKSETSIIHISSILQQKSLVAQFPIIVNFLLEFSMGARKEIGMGKSLGLLGSCHCPSNCHWQIGYDPNKSYSIATLPGIFNFAN